MGATAINIFPKQSLMAITQKYLEDNSISKNELANRLELSRTAVSRYLSGDYPNPVAIEGKLREYFAAVNVDCGAGTDSTAAIGRRPEFFESADARRITAVCSSCQEYTGLGIIVGKSGYGKTHALKYYAQMPKTSYVECDDTMGSRDLVEALERTLGIVQTYGTIWRRVNGIRAYLNANPGWLIIIDEADKLLNKYTQKKMEILRGIVDQSQVGMVIAGEPRLEALIKGYLPRLANRVDFFYSLSGLQKKEVAQYLANYPLAADALAEMTSRACNPKTGCFRLLDRTLNNVLRLMGDMGSTQITLDTIGKASDMMML